jgi:uncharacterized protein (DUF1697 family)
MRYVALLRGIGPSDPNMRGEKLRVVFEGLGFTKVHPVIASGNVVFDSSIRNIASLETKIEKELPLKLGFTRIAIVRSRTELEALAAQKPFKGVKDEKPNYLVVTFFKDRRPELCTVVDMAADKTPDFMVKLERTHGKAITTRTWKTVNRILTKMEAIP